MMTPMDSFCSEMSINYGILFSGLSINVKDKRDKTNSAAYIEHESARQGT
jgi:hypothetical protein